MAQLDVIAAAWKSKLSVDDTIVFGGDLAASGSPATWSSGAQSTYRTAALSSTDYLEIDFTFDAKTAGHGILVGLTSQYVTPASPPLASIAASFIWDTDNHLKACEGAVVRNDVGVITLPMSCRIIYNAGVLTWRRNAGSDTLTHTSVRTADQIIQEMMNGLQIIVFFFNSSGKIHATLKGGDAATPEVTLSGGGTGRLGLPILSPQGLDMSSYNRALFRTLTPGGFPPSTLHPRPTVGKIWPRKQ